MLDGRRRELGRYAHLSPYPLAVEVLWPGPPDPSALGYDGVARDFLREDVIVRRGDPVCSWHHLEPITYA